LDTYSGTYNIRWTDLDANGHVNYSAFIDAAADLRYRFFTECGLPPESFLKAGIGAVYNALAAQFLREVLVGDIISISYTLTGLSPKGIHWKIHHDIFKSNGKKAVMIDLEGVVLDLVNRKPTAPSPELLAAFHQIPRSPTFEVLPDGRFASGA
jgi:acyl-CoA thioester hydrolase